MASKCRGGLGSVTKASLLLPCAITARVPAMAHCPIMRQRVATICTSVEQTHSWPMRPTNDDVTNHVARKIVKVDQTPELATVEVTWHALSPAQTLSSCLIQIPITHAFHAVANRDGHIGRGDLADRTNKY